MRARGRAGGSIHLRDLMLGHTALYVLPRPPQSAGRLGHGTPLPNGYGIATPAVPQHISLPEVVRPQVRIPFACIEISRSADGTAIGRLLRCTDNGRPSWPYWFDPQQYATPPAIPQV